MHDEDDDRLQARIRNARMAIARDRAELMQARETGDLRTERFLTQIVANRRVYLAELLGRLPRGSAMSSSIRN